MAPRLKPRHPSRALCAAGAAYTLGNTHGWVDRIISNWELQGTGRWQSGNLLNFGNVRLISMTSQDLQNSVALRFDDANKLIYFDAADIIKNTIAAYNTSATTATATALPVAFPRDATSRLRILRTAFRSGAASPLR